MDSSPSPAPRKRRIWPWIVAALCTPVVILAAAVLSCLTLDRPAATMKRQVMAASNADWNTKVQFSVGRLPFWMARGCLAFVPDREVAEARQALSAVKSVSVGVYRLASGKPAWSRDALFNETDRRMRGQGWSRLVGVVDGGDNVMIYTRDGDDDFGRLCLAVANGQDLVVASVALDSDALVQLVDHHAGQEMRKRFAALRH